MCLKGFFKSVHGGQIWLSWRIPNIENGTMKLE